MAHAAYQLEVRPGGMAKFSFTGKEIQKKPTDKPPLTTIRALLIVQSCQ
jgi:hypothetical protein